MGKSIITVILCIYDKDTFHVLGLIFLKEKGNTNPGKLEFVSTPKGPVNEFQKI